ncbi:jg6847 [Pararge aegeria aegeria]|uniref:DNA-directed RNA polymerase n=1 Tax=Pararge aegeria aegeria TaxID=348720 RepID=A0A8S4S9S7_9NEOP|nr:jg6847 [Pararge aegeria aegeria]
MHRLLSAKNLCQNNFHGVTLPSTNTFKSISLSQIKCSFCRKVLLTSHCTENLFLARHQSTRTANAVRSLKKKTKHKSYKKYGELMQVNETSMTEMKVSISKLNASHLSKLASSPVSLGQLHQLTTKSTKNIEVDKELLQSVREKILKKAKSDIKLEDDKCALIFTNHKITSLEERLNTKQYIDMVKESYYNFRKATIYDQRLQDLRYAINEGLNQEFPFESSKSQMVNSDSKSLPKSPHTVFRELFIDKQLDSYDQELMSQITNLQMQGLSHPAIEEICDDSVHTEIGDVKEDLSIDSEISHINSLNVKKMHQAIKQKKKKLREKRRAAKEANMKQDMREMERRGKEESLQKLLTSHLQLLCSLDMTLEGRQVLQYYRKRNARAPEHPKVSSVKVYNTLLHGFASLGQLENVTELLSFMSEDRVEPNAQTFAAVFECVERSNLVDKNSALHCYHTQMQEQGLTLNDLLDKTKFLHNQREMVLKAVRRLDPHYEPNYTPPELDYDCPLLDRIRLDNVENRKGLMTSPAKGLLTLEDLKLKGKEQLAMEMAGEIEVQNIAVKEEATTNVESFREKYNEIEKEWRSVIHEAFERNMSTLKSRSNASHSAITLYPYLKVLQVEQFVQLIMSEISKLVDGSESYSPTLKLLQRDLGTQVYNKYQIEQYRRNGVLEKIEQIYEKYCKWYLERHPLDDTHRPYNGRQAWQLLVHQHREGASLNIEEAPWPIEIRQNIGKFLYNIIINDVKIDVNMFKQKAKVKKLPAVYKVHRPWGRLVRLELKPHPALSRLWASAARPQLKMRAALAPTRAPPAPWLAPTANGAYLLTATPLVRMPYYVMAQTKRLEEASPATLYPVMDSLNQLGEVPWVINQPVLDLQMKIFRLGGDKKLDIPPPSSSLDSSQWAGVGGDQSPASAMRRRVAINRVRAEMHSLWCDALYKLSLANHYRNCLFWLPHNMDFRGRVYAVGPHVSVLGADAARALLQLASQRPLGPKGLSWLKLHAINLTGTKKRSTVAERLEYAESIIDKILDSADNPLDGEGWWKKSEEPWQTLACCMEIANAMRSPNPEEYMCGFPVHQDGSCNGLQHYAALGGDASGAAAVNLAPRDKPQDVYSEIVALVMRFSQSRFSRFLRSNVLEIA